MAPPTYEIHVVGSVPDELTPALGHDVRIVEQEMRTVLTGSFIDRDGLYEFLEQLRTPGLNLAEVRAVPNPDTD